MKEENVSKVEINVYDGGQVNVAKNDATVYASQNNDKKKILLLIRNKKNLKMIRNSII